MAKKSKMLTTKEFSQLSGVSVSTLNKWIRDEKIKAKKESGRWMIAEEQLKAKAVKDFSGSASVKTAAGAQKKSPKPPKRLADVAKKTKKTAKPDKAPKKTPAGTKTYSVDEFSQLTYLTDFGVRQFLKQGRLKGEIDSGGTWKVFAENLHDPLIQHLLR
jgi:hypothetical protein